MTAHNKLVQTQIKKDIYLKEIDGFIKFLVEAEKKSNLSLSFTPKWERWKKHLRENKLPEKIEITSFTSAFKQYYWPISNEEPTFKNNETKLLGLEKQISIALADKDDNKAFIAAIKILDWGQVFKGSVSYMIDRLDQNQLAKDISAAVKILDGDIWEIDNQFVKNKLRMDSGLTKIYSLASDNSIIYDDRVGAALGYLVKCHLSKKNPPEADIPPSLQFMVGRDKSQNPSEGKLKFPRHTEGRSPLHARSNLLANWLISELVIQLNTSCIKSNERWTKRHLEAALFIIGYEVN